MKDVHAQAPAHDGLELHEVGVSGVRVPIDVERRGRSISLGAEFSVHVDLPAARKGSDLSRNAELLGEVVEAAATRPVPGLEGACVEIADRLLERHPYARRARVAATALYFLPREPEGGRRSFEEYRLFAGASAHRSGGRDWSIGAEAVGMTACPCAMESCRALLRAEYPALGGSEWDGFPIISHNQRNRTRLELEFDGPAEIEADMLIEAIEAAQSSPTYAILKRGDEARVVLAAHRNPKFVEDVLRDLLASLPGRFPGLPPSTRVVASTRSEESIHKYDVTAEHRVRLGEIRRAPGA